MINKNDPQLTSFEVDQMVWAQSDKANIWNCYYDIFISKDEITMDQRDQFGYPTTVKKRTYFSRMHGKPAHFQGCQN